MDALPKGQVAILLAIQDERIWLRELRWIVIGRAQAEHDLLTRANFFVTDAQISFSNTRGELYRAIVAQKFGHSQWEQRGIGAQTFHLLRVAQKGEKAVAEQMRC